jgi:hypothetical protein
MENQLHLANRGEWNIGDGKWKRGFVVLNYRNTMNGIAIRKNHLER